MSKVTEYWDTSALITYESNPQEEYEAYLRAEFPAEEGKEDQWYPHKDNLITLKDFQDYISELISDKCLDLIDQINDLEDKIKDLKHRLTQLETLYYKE